MTTVQGALVNGNQQKSGANARKRPLSQFFLRLPEENDCETFPLACGRVMNLARNHLAVSPTELGWRLFFIKSSRCLFLYLRGTQTTINVSFLRIFPHLDLTNVLKGRPSTAHTPAGDIIFEPLLMHASGRLFYHYLVYKALQRCATN